MPTKVGQHEEENKKHISRDELRKALWDFMVRVSHEWFPLVQRNGKRQRKKSTWMTSELHFATLRFTFYKTFPLHLLFVVKFYFLVTLCVVFFGYLTWINLYTTATNIHGCLKKKNSITNTRLCHGSKDFQISFWLMITLHVIK